MLGALACSLLVLIAGMVVFVFANAWPSFAHNGLAWFGSGGNVDQQLGDIFNSPANPDDYVYELRAWPLLWGTFLTTAGAVVCGHRDRAVRRRSSSSSSRRRACSRCSSRWCGCWRPCRR